MKRGVSWLAWLWFLIGAFYFIIPLWGTLVFSLQKQRGTIRLSLHMKLHLQTLNSGNVSLFQYDGGLHNHRQPAVDRAYCLLGAAAPAAPVSWSNSLRCCPSLFQPSCWCLVF